MSKVFVSGSFDDLQSRQVRFLEESSRLGSVHVLLWSDEVAEAKTGSRPKFPQAERQYFLEAIRYVEQISMVKDLENASGLPPQGLPAGCTWAVTEDMHNPTIQSSVTSKGIQYRIIPENQLRIYPKWRASALVPAVDRKKVLVTGCYDWLHTGHVRFFEETSQLGDLYVVIGTDANVRLLKGEGHPLFLEPERLYMVQAIRYVTKALVATGSGWMDAEPEIAEIQPDIYAVNEDGDKPEKRAFCQEHNLEYVVLKRTPKEGLPTRTSTHLRGY
jgi:cytidyltransferase-like protein